MIYDEGKPKCFWCNNSGCDKCQRVILTGNAIYNKDATIDDLKKQLKEANYTINSLIHHFHRYGMDEGSLVILMEVEKAREYLTKYKVKE